MAARVKLSLQPQVVTMGEATTAVAMMVAEIMAAVDLPMMIAQFGGPRPHQDPDGLTVAPGPCH